jgi:hypothetical protein
MIFFYIHFTSSTDYLCCVLHSSLFCLWILCIFYNTLVLIYYSSLAKFLFLSLLILIFPFPSLGEGSLWNPSSLLFSSYLSSFPGVNWPGRVVHLSTNLLSRLRMCRVMFLLGLYAFVAHTGISFIPQELNFDFHSYWLFSLKKSCTRLIIKLTREKQERNIRSVGNVGCKNIIAVIFQFRYMCQNGEK